VISKTWYLCLRTSSNLFSDCDGLELPIRWRNKPVIWRLCLALEDFEHKRDALEAEHVISAQAVRPGPQYEPCFLYLFAGISIFNWGASCLPLTIGRSCVEV
jgi:hypothetical protein